MRDWRKESAITQLESHHVNGPGRILCYCGCMRAHLKFTIMYSRQDGGCHLPREVNCARQRVPFSQLRVMRWVQIMESRVCARNWWWHLAKEFKWNKEVNENRRGKGDGKISNREEGLARQWMGQWKDHWLPRMWGEGGRGEWEQYWGFWRAVKLLCFI